MKYNSQVTSSNSWSPSSNYVPQKHWQWFCDTLEADCNLRRNVKSMTCTSSRVTRMAEGHNTSTVFRSSLFNICSKLEMVVEIHPEGFWGVLGNHISRTPVRIFAIKMSEFCYPHIKQEVFFFVEFSKSGAMGGNSTVPCRCPCALEFRGKGQPVAVHKLISIYLNA